MLRGGSLIEACVGTFVDVEVSFCNWFVAIGMPRVVEIVSLNGEHDYGLGDLEMTSIYRVVCGSYWAGEIVLLLLLLVLLILSLTA